MNVDLQAMLAQRAESVEPPTFDPQQIVVQGERLVRRRHRLVAAGVALAVVLTLGTVSVLASRGADRRAPSEPVGVPEWTSGTRPLAFGEGQTLHLGERELDTGLDFVSLDLTDDGAALTTLDGGVWFTDGTGVDRIGTTLGVRHIGRDSFSFFVGRPYEWVVTDQAGSLVAWMEFRGRVDRPELVVYDSATDSVLARQPVEVADRNSATVVAVADRAVFVAEDDRGSFDATPVFRYDVDSGVLAEVDDADVEAARRGVDRVLVVGSATDGAVLGSPDRTSYDTHTSETVDVRDSRLEHLADPHTGDQLEVTVPAAYDGESLWFTQWLDDDRFALTSSIGRPTGDLLVCHVADGRCEVAIDQSSWGDVLLPGHGGIGYELALGRAMRARNEDGS